MMSEVKIMTAEELIEYCKKAYKENRVIETQILVIYSDTIQVHTGENYHERLGEYYHTYTPIENRTAKLDTARICYSPYVNADVSVCLPRPDFGFDHVLVGFVPLSANPTVEEVRNALSETEAELIDGNQTPQSSTLYMANERYNHWGGYLQF